VINRRLSRIFRIITKRMGSILGREKRKKGEGDRFPGKTRFDLENIGETLLDGKQKHIFGCHLKNRRARRRYLSWGSDSYWERKRRQNCRSGLSAIALLEN